MRAINIVGCGRAGRTFARLFSQAQAFVVQDLYDLEPAAARACARFAGAGRPVRRLGQMQPAAVWLIATTDDALVEAAAGLASAGTLVPGDIVAHLSGATPSTDLIPLIALGAHAASFHPVKTFADPAHATASFRGTYVALEGERRATRVLRVALRKIGARVFDVEPQRKVLYHAGSVMVCNYLVALMEAGLRCYQGAGIARDTARALMEPLVRETVDHLFRTGTVGALTGPIARGDDGVVTRQAAAVATHDRLLGALYRDLGQIAVALARSKGEAPSRRLDRISRVLRG